MNLRFLLYAFLILSAMNGTQAATNDGDTGGLLGTDLGRARLQADYFRFFNLEPIGPTQHLENGEQLLAFKPSGAAFRDLVTIYVRTDPKGLISMFQVVIARSFLDDPRTGVYARDLIKSSLLDCVNESDAGNLKVLISRIALLRAATGSRQGMTVVTPGKRAQSALSRGSLRLPVIGTAMRGDPAGPGRRLRHPGDYH